MSALSSGSRWTAADLPDLREKTAIVTGATSGIGRVTALELARHGARVIVAVRNAAAGAELVAELPGEASVLPLDLSSMASVRSAAAMVEEPIDILVNNAGVMYPPQLRRTDDGHEVQFQTNHLGHFALTGLLLPRLLEAGSGAPRVTTVASIAHWRGGRQVVKGNLAGRYDPMRTYGNSKLANLLFATELQRRASAAGSALTSTAAHPGVSGTNLFGSSDGMGGVPVVGWLGSQAVRLLFPGPDAGAEATLYAATLAEPGSYVGPTSFKETRGAIGEARRSELAQDEALAAELWAVSEELTGVAFDFGGTS